MRLLLTVFFLLALPAVASNEIAGDPPLGDGRHFLTAYNTYAYRETEADDQDGWVAPMRLYVHERRLVTERAMTAMARVAFWLDSQEAAIFRSRTRDIAADSESGLRPEIRFDNDPEERVYSVRDAEGNARRTRLSGTVDGLLTLPEDHAETLLYAQGSESGWLSFRVSAGRHEGRGRVQLIEPEGVSVISDIDDTVKVTEMPAGRRTVVRNMFFKEYEAAPGMAELYSEWDEAAFHYVSGSPWQLYNSLSGFLFSEAVGFPRGSLHMKTVRKNPFSINTWRDLSELASNENVTFDQKLGQIEQILRHFPEREFILVGDSGERDPDIYRVVRENFPEQVRAIYIRDVVNDRELRPERLDGMEIIPAPTVLHRSLQID
ncbi:MAG: App1 family protein [Natronospirillum sp.]|uniref:phosphatidate phosphatase App1 family protein n=1 Tax=Natronospirillum sp. TaxID=2812955 RepID=UPI0025EBF38B|nr:App1 family protein [Natronospirillum sp.]MCH8550680.1 App1 family protein [Natronospirillum sp.]